MTCFELSRTAQPASNPNTCKPKLSLGSLRRNPETLPETARFETQLAGVQIGEGDIRKQVCRAGDDKIKLADQTGDGEPSEAPKKPPTASSLLGAATASPPRLVVRSDSLARLPMPFAAMPRL